MIVIKNKSLICLISAERKAKNVSFTSRRSQAHSSTIYKKSDLLRTRKQTHPTSFPRSPVSPSLRWRGPPSAQTCTSARSRRTIASRGAPALRIRTWPRIPPQRARKRPLSLELKQALIWMGELQSCLAGRKRKACCKCHAAGYLGRASEQVMGFHVGENLWKVAQASRKLRMERGTDAGRSFAPLSSTPT